MGSTLEHQELVDDILLALGTLPNVRVWKNVTGVARQGERVIAFGLKGAADISGILAPQGRRLELEIKTGDAVQSPRQKNFEKMIIRFGGIYRVCRSVDDALSAIGLGKK